MPPPAQPEKIREGDGDNRLLEGAQLMSAKWSEQDIPDQSGRVAVVTGANSGLGLITARELARAGAEVIMTSRDAAKGAAAADEIRGVLPEARLAVGALDLADLSSVRAFSKRVAEERAGIDLLINNAGVMAPPRGETADGFETQFGTNHLGHFALTGLLLGTLGARPGSRVVTVSSTAHRAGRINFDDLGSEHGYNNWIAYSQSKLANLLFAFELDRRLRAAGMPIRSIAVHPGYSATNLQFAGPARFYEKVGGAIANVVIAQSAEQGTLPTLYGATAPDVPGGSFVGPDGFFELRGRPKIVKAKEGAYDWGVAARLWEISEDLTGVHFAFGSSTLTG
jgi:NAD(P)-dependent dehydrogenase (short-subunit alcohol dehydrogenase family)